MGARVDGTTPCEHLTLRREHRDPGNLIGDVHRTAGIDVDVHRLVEIAPLPVEVALGAEELYPIVLAVGDEDPVARIDPDAVRRRELRAPQPGTTPRLQMLPIGREPMHRGI